MALVARAWLGEAGFGPVTAGVAGLCDDLGGCEGADAVDVGEAGAALGDLAGDPRAELVDWWRNTMISRSLERPDRIVRQSMTSALDACQPLRADGDRRCDR